MALIKSPKKDMAVTFLLLPPGVLVDQASRTYEKGSNVPKITSESALNQPKTLSSVHRSLTLYVPLKNSVMYREGCPFDGAFLKRRQREAKAFGENLGVVGLEPRTSSLKHTCLLTRVQSNALMRTEIAV